MDFEEDIKHNNLFIMLSKKFNSHLLHGDFFLSQFDVIILDEVNLIFDTHPNTMMMLQYYYNNDKDI